MSYPSDGGLMFNRRRLDDITVYELPAERMQKPSADGAVASSTRTTRYAEPLQQDFRDVHEPGA
jgi:hypothetical protein